MTERNAVIVGAGIGGLAAAIALSRRGWNITVVEQAPALREVGSGISLWPNAVRALDLLGVGDEVREHGAVEGAGGFRDAHGRWLFRSDMRTSYGESLMLRRSVLLDVLTSAVPADLIRLDTEVTVDAMPDGDILVGADGLRSTVRAAFWPDAAPPVYAGYTTWRLIAPALDLDAEVSESWGRGERAGIFRLADGALYCYFTARTAPGIEYADDLAELKRRFGHWHDPIPTVLDRCTEVLRHDIYKLPPLRSYVTGRAVLLGDAAHAMTPDLGQGGGTALEDAVELAEALDSTPDIALGLARYDQGRRRRTQAIARQSALFGAFAQASGRFTVPLRNTAARLLSQALFLRSVRPMLDWHALPLHAEEDRDARQSRQQPGQSG